MFVNGRGRIYMLDRDNSVFCVHNLSFPDRSDLDRHLTNTLLDGVTINLKIKQNFISNLRSSWWTKILIVELRYLDFLSMTL